MALLILLQWIYEVRRDDADVGESWMSGYESERGRMTEESERGKATSKSIIGTNDSLNSKKLSET